MCKGIDFSTLTLTIREAITITRRSGLRYIWIDSLCIIQDSDDDKKVELGKMAEIYENAHLTIIAASAKEANDGFLDIRPTPEILVKTPVGTYDPSLGTILLRRHRDVCLADDSLDQTETRAWCFQESILGPRCLVYSSLNLHWGCHDVPYADRDQVARDYGNAYGIVNRKVGNLPHVFRSGRQGDSLALQDEEELYSFWNSVVEEYAGRQISFQMIG